MNMYRNQGMISSVSIFQICPVLTFYLTLVETTDSCNWFLSHLTSRRCRGFSALVLSQDNATS